MWETLALAYEGTSQVRNYKISMLVHQYELFKMEDNKILDLIFGKTCENYDHITKNLRSLLRMWRP
ncbi:hypothetical protein CR513_46406, partial [Mucuna pruriens]